MRENMNYNDMLYNLRKFEYNLLEFNTKGFSTFEIDLILLEAKAYIEGTDFLKKEYDRRIKEFQAKYKNNEYIKNYENAYEQIKGFSIQKANSNQRTLKYMQPYLKENSYMPYNADVCDNENHHRFFIDYPEIYYYPSLRAHNISLSGAMSNVDDFKDLKIVPNLTSFYYAFCNDTEFIRDINIVFPKNLSFFITLGNIKVNTPFADYTRVIFNACAMCEVLSKLQDYVESERLNKVFITPPNHPIDLPQEIQACTPQEIKIFQIFYNTPQKTVTSVSKQLSLSSSRINDIIKKLCIMLSLPEENLSALRTYINDKKNK